MIRPRRDLFLDMKSPVSSSASRSNREYPRLPSPQRPSKSGRFNLGQSIFKKRARPPSEDDVASESPSFSVAGTVAEEKEPPGEKAPSGDPSRGAPGPSLEVCNSFRKKAREPEGPLVPAPSNKSYEELRVPKRKDPRTADKYIAYHQKALKLFEDLVILGVKMDPRD